jgi:aminoglycoside phosphotransferase (APT) family kinase protein
MSDQDHDPRDNASMQRTSRDHEDLKLALQKWLATKLPEGADPQIAKLSTSSATGMSSETVLFPAIWKDGETLRAEDLVCRIAPHPDDVPVFPTYDMKSQFEVIQKVGELTAVPVPNVRWLELDTSVLGTPFFVMDRIEGIAPPDNPPYTFGGNWFTDATDEQRRTLQESTLDVIIALHAIPDAEQTFGFLFTAEEQAAGPTPLHRKVARTRRWYDWTVEHSGEPSPLVESVFAWLEANWPKDVGETVLSWGDSRVGNVLYRDFVPTAVLDWEMAAVCPREVDLGWSIYAHRIFQDMSSVFDVAGLPNFLDKDDVAAYYEAKTGYAPRDLDWYITYSALQYAIVFLRTGARSVHFGEREAPGHVDELIFNREPLERMMAGTYWE